MAVAATGEEETKRVRQFKPYLSAAFSSAKSSYANMPVFKEDCLILLGICFVVCRLTAFKNNHTKRHSQKETPLDKESKVIITYFYKAQADYLMNKAI